VGESEPLPIAYVDKSLTPPIYRLGARSCINSRSSNARKQKGPAQLPCGPGHSALQRLAGFSTPARACGRSSRGVALG